MKILRPAAFLFAALALAVVPAQAQLIITEVMSQTGAGGTQDWFELKNVGSAPINLAGYTMDDNSYSFAASVALQGITSLSAGQTAVFLESTDTTTPGSEIPAFRTFWGGSAASALIGFYQGSGVSLGASGDGVIVFTPGGATVTRVAFGAATSGSTFYGNSLTTPTFTAISTVGQDGAYASAGTITDGSQNIGSPGFSSAVVPEPSTYAMLGMGLVLVAGMVVKRAGWRAA